MARWGVLILVVISLGMSLASSAQAYTAGGPIATEIQNLFWAITFFAVVVVVVVFGVLLGFLIRYRQSVSPRPTSWVEHDRRLEILWSVVPSIILVVILVLSIPVLVYTDTIPRADTRIQVIGQQFVWTFKYEDGTNSTPDLWIQENIVVRLEITSLDVVHSFAVPDLGIKIDAFPGHMNNWWMKADKPGDYLIQCAEFCGVNHHGMRGVVHVFRAGSQPGIYGPPPQEPPTANVELLESGGNATQPWKIVPVNLTFAIGSKVSLHIMNSGSRSHDFRVDAPVNVSVPAIPPLQSVWLNFSLDVSSPTPIPYGPTNQSTRALGMAGTLTIQSGRVIVILLSTNPQGNFFIGPDPPQNPLGIAKGESVVFALKNADQLLGHNFQMGAPYEFVKYAGIISPGQTVFIGPFTFDEDASNEYWCILHRPTMFANYVVGSGSAAPAGIPLFDMTAIMTAVSVPVVFAYVFHHARRRGDSV